MNFNIAKNNILEKSRGDGKARKTGLRFTHENKRVNINRFFILLCSIYERFLHVKMIVSFRSIERIVIKRLTNAVIDLGNLPFVSVLEVSSNAFDGRSPCQVITENRQPVTVVLGEQSPEKFCVSVILLI